MKKSTRSWKERICALLLAAAMVITWMIPNAALTAEAAPGDAGAVYFSVRDVENSNTLLTQDVTIKVLDSNNDEVAVTPVLVSDSSDSNHLNMFKVTGLEADAVYTYTVEKTGYEYQDAMSTKSFTTSNSEQVVTVDMKMSDIQLSDASLTLNVGSNRTVSVTNPVSEKIYKWEVISGQEYVSVDSTGCITAIKGGNAGDDEPKTAKVQVGNESRSKDIDVTVQKLPVSGMTLSVTPSEGTDQNSVRLEANGLPKEATGSLIFKNYNSELSIVEKNDQTTITYDYQPANGLVGNYNFSVEYSGDTKYRAASANANGTYKKTMQLASSNNENEKTLTYGDTGWEQEFDITMTNNSVADRTLTYSLEFVDSTDTTNPAQPSDVAGISKNNNVFTVTPKGAGKIKIIISAAESETYAADTFEYILTINREQIDINDITWDSDQTKVYDGTTGFELKGTVKDRSETITIPATSANTSASDVDSDLSVTISSGTYYAQAETGAANTMLVLDEDTTVLNIVAITPRTLYLTSAGKLLEVEYGRNMKTAVEQATGLVSLYNNNGAKENDQDSGLVGSDAVLSLPGATITGSNTKLSVGEHKVIIPNVTDSNKVSGNYQFIYQDTETDRGTLDIKEQTVNASQIMSGIELTEASAVYGIKEGDSLTQVYAAVNAETIYGEQSENTSFIKLSVRSGSEFDGYYDTVYVKIPGVNNSKPIDATNDGISLSALASIVSGKQDASAVSGVQIYLGISGQISTVTKTVDMNDWLYIDNQSPIADITNFEPTVFSTLGNAVSFGLFDNEYYNAEISVAEKGSGIDSNVKQYFYVHSLGSSITDDDLSKTAIKDIIQEVESSGKWKELKLDGEGKDTIPVGRASDESAIANNYLIFIKTTDNADNSSVYVSNGIVIDIDIPTVSCSFDNKNQVLSENNILYYSDDAAYTLTVEDPENYFSGISKLEVSITQDGKSVTGSNTTEVITEIDTSQIYENSFTYEPTAQDAYTYTQLTADKKLEIKGKIVADNITSNNVTMTVKAIDRAGNESTVLTQSLIIDNTAPMIEVSYDKDKGQIVDNYFQDTRTMTVTYTERNLGFDTSGDFELTDIPEDNIWFEVKREGENTASSYSLAELDALDGGSAIDVTLISDSQQDSGLTGYTDEREVEFQIVFKGQNEYTVTPYVKDKLGYQNNGTEETFIVDTEAPVVKSIDYTYFNVASGQYEPFDPSEPKNTAIRMTVTIQEHFFKLPDDQGSDLEEGQIALMLTADKRADGDSTDYQTNYANDAKVKSNWSSGDASDEWKITFEFSNDAKYTMNLTYSDLSGKNVSTGEQKFTYDATQPEGTISIDGTSIWQKIWSVITFNIFKNSSYSVSLTSEDATSGVASTAYYKTANPITQAAVERLPESSWTAESSFSVSPDEQFVTYARIIDKAGNVRYLYPTNGAIADATRPTITITEANPGAARNGIYSSDVKLNVSVEDPTSGGTYSGLKSVTYNIQATGNVNASQDGILHMAAEDVQSHKTYNGTITVDADTFNSNDVKVTVNATDFSGNTYSKDISLKIDVTEPTIDVTYDLNSPLNDRYYNATRTATVTVTERNFDPSAVRFNITNTDGTQPSISGWSHSSNSGVSDSATHTCTVTFSADGDYTFTLNTTDLAGNDSNYTRVDDFTIDQTDPTIQVSYDNNNDAEPGYFNADRTATITVTEHNFNAAEVNTAITASLEGRGVATPGLGGWSTRGDVHTASVTFSADADYTFDVDYTDLAGNAAADYEQDSFTVDQTAPELEFFDIEDKSANNDVVAPGVSYSDNNYTENGVEITLEGANHGEMALDGDRSSIPNGESIKMADFERTKENDDLYTMTAVITDRAGNETEDSVIFSVNRFGSVFILSDETQELVDNYYTNEEQDLVVTEINVDSLVFNGISYGRDGQLADLKAGTDYTVKASGSEVSWKQYDYTINKENFEKEGNYTVTIDSEDRATNVGNSRAKGCDIEFAIDKTAPTVVITGIENGEQYRANTRNITVNATDNIAMGDVGVYVGNDDQPAQSYDAKDIQAAGGELTYTMNSSNSRQDIRAVATDAAGNTAEAEITRVLLTSNLFVQFYSNTPLLVGTIVGVVVIAGGLLWFFLIFKKKKDEEQANK